MSHTAMQIPKPLDEQDFERKCAVLFECVLGDPAIDLYGRRGQTQYGVDIIGLRNGNIDQIVGIQCKLKGQEKKLTENEVKEEVEKARLFAPPLSEYIIATTAPKDAKLDSLALKLSDHKDQDHPLGMRVCVWGWETLQRKINRYQKAIQAFAPSYLPLTDHRSINSQLSEIHEDIRKKGDEILVAIRSSLHTFEPDVEDSATNDALESQINEYATLVRRQPSKALTLLELLLENHGSTASNHILFRIVSNIAGCHLNLGNDDGAATGFIEAFDLDPENPNAIANKALGFLINKDWDSLRSFAEANLPIHPDNARLAAFYIHSLIDDQAISDPLYHVPDAVRNSAEVMIANVRWLMEQGGDGDWWEPAKAAHKTYPQNHELLELYACALLERVLEQSVFLYGRELGEADRNCIEKAIEIYSSLWLEIYDNPSVVREEQISVAINLVTAYRIHDQAEEALRVGNQARTLFRENEALKISVAAVLVEQREFGRALDLISDIRGHPEALTMRCEIALMKNDWQTIYDLVSNELDSFPERRRTFPEAIGVIAQVELASAENRRSILDEHRNDFQGDAFALISLAQRCQSHGFDDLAENYFSLAITAVEAGDDRLDSRTLVAQEALDRKQYETAISMLSGLVPVDRESQALLMLARAYISLYPIRQRAIDFFEKLPTQIRELHDFQKMEGILHLNRGNPRDAIDRFSRAFEKNTCVDNLIHLIRAHLYACNEEAVRFLLSDPNIDTLPGSSLDRLRLCHFLIHIGENEQAIDMAYKALIDEVSSRDIVVEYLKVVLELQPHFQEKTYDEVAQGRWVRFTSHKDKSYQVIVGESADRLWGERADLSNTFISHALGKKVNDRFEYTNALNTTEIWTISEIKPRWLQAFHYLSDVLYQKFPEVNEIGVFSIAEDNPQALLDQVRHVGEAMYNQAIPYLMGKTPMAFVAKGMIGGSIAFADYLVSVGKSIHVNSGAENEQAEAHSWIDSNDHSGAVIDALTAWRAAELGIFPTLRQCLGPLRIPASEMAIIRTMLQSKQSDSSRETTYLGYSEGKYFHQSITPEEQCVRVDNMKGLADDIEEACSIEFVVIPDELPDSVEQILSSPVGDAFACAILAREGNLLLLYEDMIMRQGARVFLDVKGVWIQAVLSSALRNEKLARDVYSDALVQLVLRRHSHTSVSALDLLSVFERDKNPNLTQLKILCSAFDSKTADRDSHVKVVVDFINLLWEDGRYDGERLTNPTAIVLNALLLNKNSKRDLWYPLIFNKLNSAPQVFFAKWCKEHPSLL